MQSEPITPESYLSGRDSLTSRLRVRNWLGGIFGCQHKEMSRPFSRQGESYRVCLTCGARRQFIESTWETSGPFYFSGAQASDSPLEKKARKIGRRPSLVKSAAA